MSLDAALNVEARTPSALIADPAAVILKHTVKIWAREHGVAESDLSRITDMVVEFAGSTIHGYQRGAPANA